MNKLIIIGACIAGILGILDILNTDLLKYVACALLGYTAFITLGELNPKAVRQQTIGQSKYPKTIIREKPKDIWGEFEPTPKEEVKLQEPNLKIEDTNVKQDKIQNPKEMQKAG